MIFLTKKSKYFKLLKEFLPRIIKEAHQAAIIGEPYPDHTCDNCEDCEWYDWGLSILKRLEQGEFDEIISERTK